MRKHGGNGEIRILQIMTRGEKIGEAGTESNDGKPERSAVPPHFMSLKGRFGNNDPAQIATTLSVTVT